MNDLQNAINAVVNNPKLWNDFQAFSAAVDVAKEERGLSEEDAIVWVLNTWNFPTIDEGSEDEVMD